MSLEKFQSFLSDLSSALLVMLGIIVAYVVLSRMKRTMRSAVIEDGVHWIEHSRFHRNGNEVCLEFHVPKHWNDEVIIRSFGPQGEVFDTIFQGVPAPGEHRLTHPIGDEESIWIEMASTGQKVLRRLS